MILTEIDFEKLDDKAIRRLFVGATRATMKLMLVVSEEAAGVLRERLANPGGARPVAGRPGGVSWE